MENYEIEFWEKYLNANILERIKLVENLPIRKMLRDLEKINDEKITEKVKNQMVAQLLNSYFEDLESAVYTKTEIEKNK